VAKDVGELEIPPGKEADVYLEVAARRVADQLSAVDALDNKIAAQLGLATTMITISLGLLAIRHDNLPDATVALAILAGALYLVTLALFLVAFHSRDWSSGPSLEEAEEHARLRSLRVQRWWAADTFKTAASDNEALYARKARWSWILLATVSLLVVVNGAGLLIALASD
jgi:hypothetical protein